MFKTPTVVHQLDGQPVKQFRMAWEPFRSRQSRPSSRPTAHPKWRSQTWLTATRAVKGLSTATTQFANANRRPVLVGGYDGPSGVYAPSVFAKAAPSSSSASPGSTSLGVFLAASTRADSASALDRPFGVRPSRRDERGGRLRGAAGSPGAPGRRRPALGGRQAGPRRRQAPSRLPPISALSPDLLLLPGLPHAACQTVSALTNGRRPGFTTSVGKLTGRIASGLPPNRGRRGGSQRLVLRGLFLVARTNKYVGASGLASYTQGIASFVVSAWPGRRSGEIRAARKGHGGDSNRFG